MLERAGVPVKGRKVLVLGSGGASVAVCHVLNEQGAEVTVISRSGENNYTNLDRHADAALVVNTTPVGMYPNTGVSPLDLDVFPKLGGVLDIIYNPLRTELLLAAKKRGIAYIICVLKCHFWVVCADDVVKQWERTVIKLHNHAL